ncbi:MAG TPA: L,D-transpeptidase family protein [Gammaproteobacteria bacterium]|nr:L,D-transpeptidase family protein [Gammaproteobacteria bacterium]
MDAIRFLLLSLAGCLLAGPVWADSAAQIRTYLEGIDAGDAALVAGEALEHPRLIAEVYRSRAHRPIWIGDAPLASQTRQVLDAVIESVDHGFVAERYHRGVIEQQLKSRQRGIALELLVSDAFIGQALHRGQGIVTPPNLDAEWQLPTAEVDAAALLLETAASGASVKQVLAALWPGADEYWRLLERRAEIGAFGETVTAQVAPGAVLKPGQSSERVVALKERLLGPGDYDPVYDEELRREVIAFQRASGLEADAFVGGNTIDALNETRVSWIDSIDANLERWRWLPRTAPTTYLRVNIAAYRLRILKDGKPVLGMNVVVGKPYRRTPVFTETIKYFVLNPTWNVPVSIATQDKLPLLKADAAAEAAKGFEAKLTGTDDFVNVDQIDWQPVTRANFHYLLRQRAGPQNALGQIKFMLPNPYDVYLHDSPSRELFAKQERSFSSGCVRLQKPLELAKWLLANDGQADAFDLEQLLATGATQTIYLKHPVPTYIVYFTVFVDDDDEVVFRRDIYSRDRILVEALRRSLP